MTTVLAKRIVAIIPKNKNGSKKHPIDLKAFIDNEVIAIVKNSPTYQHVRTSQDRDSFIDINPMQWDAVTGAILCHLRYTKTQKACLTQSVLISIAKEAAKLALQADEKIKQASSHPEDSALKTTKADTETHTLLKKALYACSIHNADRNHPENFFQPLTITDAAALQEIGWTGKLSSNRQSIPRPNSKIKSGPTFVPENFGYLTEQRKASIQFWSGLCSVLSQNNGRVWMPEVAAVAVHLGVCIPTPSQLASRLSAMTGLAVSRPRSAAGWLYCKIDNQPKGVELWSQLWMTHLVAFRKSVVNNRLSNNYCSPRIAKAIAIKTKNPIMGIQPAQRDRPEAA